MLNLEKQVDELYNNVKLQTKDFSKLEHLDKQVTSFIKKQDSLDSCQLNQISKISAKLLEIYFALEEEYELNIYQSANENLEMQDEANDISLMCIFKTGKISLETINFCFQMSLKCEDTDLKFTIAQLLDLLVINITYCRKLIDLSQAQKYDSFLNQLSSNNQVIFNLLFEELQLSEYLQNLHLCNQINLLEMKSLSQKIKFSDLISHSEEILNLFSIYPMLNVSKQNIIENILVILYQQVQECDAKKVEELIEMLIPISHMFQEVDISYYIHFLKLRLINALERKDKEQFEKLEKEFNESFLTYSQDFFLLVINAKKLKLYQEEKSVQKIFQNIEEFSNNYRQITSYQFSQLLQEICSLGNFKFTLKLFQRYISLNLDNFKQQKNEQQSFYDVIEMICTLIDEFLNFKDHKKQINEVIEGLADCIQLVIGVNSTQIINIQVKDINNQQLLCQRLAKLILEIALNLNSLKEQTIQNAIQIVQAFLIFLKNIKLDYDQSTILTNEISCVGIIFAIKLKNENYIQDFQQNTQELNLLPQLLQPQNQSFEISQIEFQKLLTSLLAANSSKEIPSNKSIINLFLLKNIIIQIDKHKNLVQFYNNFIVQNFGQYVKAFTQNFLHIHHFDKDLGISLCTPYVKKLGQLKQSISKNVEEALQILKMLSQILDRFYQYYLEQDRDISLNILILENERNELVQTMDSYFFEKSITSNLSVSCKFLHFMILYFCLETVFDNTDQFSVFEQKYFDQCMMKLLCYQQKEAITQTQTKLFQNPQFFKSLTLLFSYQVAYYESQLNAKEVQANNYCDLIEKYELSCLNLIYYEGQANSKLIDEKIKNQFFLFQYIFSILKNDVQKCLCIIEDFYQYYPDSLVLLSQISKIKQNQILSYTINKKYIYYLSLQNYSSKYFSLELVLDFVDQLDIRESFDLFYMAIKSILHNIIDQSLLQPSQLKTATYILKELIYKLKLLNPSHPEISQLSQMQKRIKWK
ncbi:hypothetical protein ABPG72_008465 [Tetrahymena utriculariae]